jgi:hypothetical protein
MSLSRKHYCAVAAIISRHAVIEGYGPELDSATKRIVGELADDLASMFASDNPNFDRARFLAACKVTA